jgi:hypothetical protein
MPVVFPLYAFFFFSSPFTETLQFRGTASSQKAMALMKKVKLTCRQVRNRSQTRQQGNPPKYLTNTPGGV